MTFDNDRHAGQAAALSREAEWPTVGRMDVAKQAGERLVGLTLYTVIAWMIDYPLYAGVVWLLGAFEGGLVMMALCLPIDLLILKAYDWSKRDWLAVEFCKAKIDECRMDGKAGLFVRLLDKCPLWMRVVLLSARFDPFLVTIMTRPGSYRFDGLKAGEYRVFLGSFLSGHLWWTASIWAGLEGIQWLLGQTW